MSECPQQSFGQLTILIDRDSCIGSGNCTKVAPDVFELDDSGVVAFRGDAPEAPDRDRLIEACDVCPVDALIARDAEGKTVVP